jgi:hypothetical protein
MEVEAKNGMHSKRLPDSHQIKKLSMKDQDNLGLEVKTKEILRQHITLSIEDQRVNLLLKQTLDGGPMVTVLVVKNGTHSKRLPDSQKIKKNSMKRLDNHGSQVKTKKIKNLPITYSTLDQALNLSHKLILINLITRMPKIKNMFHTQELSTTMEKLHFHQ